MKRSRLPIQGILLMLGASLSFAAMAAATKLVSKRLPASEIVFVRSLIASFIVAYLVSKTRSSWVGKEPKILAARGVVGFTAMILYFWCLSQLDLGTAVMLNYTSPLFAVVAARFVLREKIGRPIQAAILLSFTGVYLLAAPQFHLKPAPLIAGLLSGFLVGVVHLLIRSSHEEEVPLTIILYFTVISTIGSGFLLFQTGFPLPTAKEWLWLLVITVTSLLGQFGLTHSLRSASVSVVSPFGYLTPVFGLLLGWWIWHEAPAPGALLGGALIILSGLAMVRYHTSI
ncbi:MAG: DMT family transporter [Candidatus Omnitrophica bacterium]|nr:DMT family transporter [Candidatus Omnitrophota bacterium]